METLQNLRQEFEQEFQITRQFINRFPEGLNDYAPHEKSMKLMPLASHIVEIIGWPDYIMKTEKLDFANGDYEPLVIKSGNDLKQVLENCYKKSRETLENMTEADLEKPWTMTMGEQVIAEFNKYSAIRHALNQITHHRAQLGVYYRLNNLPLPATYGPSADQEY